jgi:hypothetical protein
MYPPPPPDPPKKRKEDEHFAGDSCKEKEKLSHMKETQPHKLLLVFFLSNFVPNFNTLLTITR